MKKVSASKAIRLAKLSIQFNNEPFVKFNKQSVLQDYFPDKKMYDCYLCVPLPERQVKVHIQFTLDKYFQSATKKKDA